MFPTIIEVFGEPLSSYFTLLLLGFALATFLAARRAEATGLDREVMIDVGLYSLIWGVIGGALFMVSDLLIGETVAYGAFPGSGVVIMLTYIVGQAIIAYCWTRRVEQTAAVDVVVVAA